jgi:hypothetical protein
MRRLEWSQRQHGWHAGRYEIELAAPGLWVCTRYRVTGADRPKIEMTAGSLSALKTNVERIETRRRTTRRAILHLSVFLISLIVIATASGSDHGFATAIVFSFAGVSVFSALRALDAVVGRAWESLSFIYQ